MVTLKERINKFINDNSTPILVLGLGAILAGLTMIPGIAAFMTAIMFAIFNPMTLAIVLPIMAVVMYATVLASKRGAKWDVKRDNFSNKITELKGKIDNSNFVNNKEELEIELERTEKEFNQFKEKGKIRTLFKWSDLLLYPIFKSLKNNLQKTFANNSKVAHLEDGRVMPLTKDTTTSDHQIHEENTRVDDSYTVDNSVTRAIDHSGDSKNLSRGIVNHTTKTPVEHNLPISHTFGR